MFVYFYLFYDAASKTDYTVSNDGVINEQLVANHMKRSGRDLI